MDSMASWLPPDGWGVRTVPCGRWWDAVRVPGVAGFRALDRLGERSGPVIEDQVGQVLTWLVRPGAAERWSLAGVAVWGRGRCLAVPPAAWVNGPWSGAPVTRWLIRPRGGCLTDAKALRATLAQVLGEPSRRGTGGGDRAPECHMEECEACTKGEVPQSPPDSSVIYEACDCACHGTGP
ncbi:hypothetical protein [Streptomyces specialis]|uniref:hypothetical protein n=1 Tax=Streptomyces specialis TaxID=498367 RepID=UPI00073F80A7|nr:hypothetical protein [Streptomyces specialis]